MASGLLAFMDSITLHRLSELAPAFGRRLHTVLLVLEGEGIWMRMVQGVRSPGQQDELYAKGRTKPGEPCTHDGVARPPGTCPEHWLGLTVTRARGLDSWHPYALAADCAPDADPATPGFQPNWDREHKDYRRYVALAKAQGLTVGDEWTGPRRDTPHVQPAELPNTPTAEDQQLFKDGGAGAVWIKYGLM